MGGQQSVVDKIPNGRRNEAFEEDLDTIDISITSNAPKSILRTTSSAPSDLGKPQEITAVAQINDNGNNDATDKEASSSFNKNDPQTTERSLDSRVQFNLENKTKNFVVKDVRNGAVNRIENTPKATDSQATPNGTQSSDYGEEKMPQGEGSRTEKKASLVQKVSLASSEASDDSVRVVPTVLIKRPSMADIALVATSKVRKDSSLVDLAAVAEQRLMNARQKRPQYIHPFGKTTDVVDGILYGFSENRYEAESANPGKQIIWLFFLGLLMGVAVVVIFLAETSRAAGDHSVVSERMNNVTSLPTDTNINT